MILKGRSICRGKTEGLALVSKTSISFYGGVDPNSGIVIEKNHELYGKSVKDKILFFPYGKGSTVGSYVLYQMSKNKTTPKAIINVKTEPIIAAGCILGDIPLVDGISERDITLIKNGDRIKIDADMGTVEVLEKAK